MHVIQQLLNQDLFQIDETKDFTQIKNKLELQNPTVFYVANKKDIDNINLALNFVRVVLGPEFIDVETVYGKSRVTKIDDAIQIIKNAI